MSWIFYLVWNVLLMWYENQSFLYCNIMLIVQVNPDNGNLLRNFLFATMAFVIVIFWLYFLRAGKYITNQWHHGIDAQTRCMSCLSINLCRVITCFRIISRIKMMHKRVKNEFLQYIMNVKSGVSLINL